ncbi:MAG: hypothetical protein GF350_09540 [Chitinivibrionales bacterium]|nr:hypothetical protein [Chitinivibrionales bacterium]
MPLVCPDLAAFLIVQMETLGELAGTLGKDSEGRTWRDKSARMLKALIHELWREDTFIARRTHDSKEVACQSLLPCVPILLGERLPEGIRSTLRCRIGTFLTNYGLATEHPDSPAYTPDGYWREPIWAPSTYIILCGLRACGYENTANTLAERFCTLCRASGFAENFNALTGESLRDPAYSWTSSVFLLCAQMLNKEKAGHEP